MDAQTLYRSLCKFDIVSYKSTKLEVTQVICSQIIENNSVLDTKVMGDNRLNLLVLYNSQITQRKNRRQ